MAAFLLLILLGFWLRRPYVEVANTLLCFTTTSCSRFSPALSAIVILFHHNSCAIYSSYNNFTNFFAYTDMYVDLFDRNRRVGLLDQRVISSLTSKVKTFFLNPQK